MILYMETVRCPYRVSYLPGLAKQPHVCYARHRLMTLTRCRPTMESKDRLSPNQAKQQQVRVPVDTHVYDRLTPTSRP